MTGFGLAEVETGGLGVRVEIRSVNHRFLQVRHRFPGELAELEPRVEALIRKRIARGALAVHVHLSRTAAPEEVSVNADVALRYRRQIARTAREVGLEDDLGMAALVQLPGVVGTRSDGGGRRRETRLVMRACGEALDSLVAAREAEGARLETDLRKHLTAIERLTRRIERRMPAVVKRHMKALRGRVAELLGGARDVPASDLARELALLADRFDVSEEVTRLFSHLEEAGAILDRGGSVGRKLDFLVQEFNREANTVGSKCNDARVAHDVVDLKTCVERLREQVQNIE
ncbi:MAG: YicC family protein [Planctomycetes bacterium]|jgi:uncharacterized protein (TIGR00255 family)|nr:YicC family protein [Planctomycetota bacterium]MDP6410900.1 YicC/YloC family endoribonuclease [Planctomycetota bacterium]